jgi:hypothetical protein
MIGKHTRHAADIGFVNHGRASQLALTLFGHLREDVSAIGLAALEAFRSLAKTLRRGPVGLQLGHRSLLFLTSSHRLRGLEAYRRLAAGHFFLGAITMVI